MKQLINWFGNFFGGAEASKKEDAKPPVKAKQEVAVQPEKKTMELVTFGTRNNDVVDRENNLNPVLLKVGRVKSVLAADMVINGDIELSDYGVRIQAHVTGNVTQRGSSLVIIDKDSVIEGEIRARYVVVLGKVKGKIVGERIVVGATALIEGDVIYRNTFTPIAGAKMRGQINQQDEALFPDEVTPMPLNPERKLGDVIVQHDNLIKPVLDQKPVMDYSRSSVLPTLASVKPVWAGKA